MFETELSSNTYGGYWPKYHLTIENGNGLLIVDEYSYNLDDLKNIIDSLGLDFDYVNGIKNMEEK